MRAREKTSGKAASQCLALAMGDTSSLLFAPLALLLKQHGINAK